MYCIFIFYHHWFYALLSFFMDQLCEMVLFKVCTACEHRKNAAHVISGVFSELSRTISHNEFYEYLFKGSGKFLCFID